jgi:hypothetical protein
VSHRIGGRRPRGSRPRHERRDTRHERPEAGGCGPQGQSGAAYLPSTSLGAGLARILSLACTGPGSSGRPPRGRRRAACSTRDTRYQIRPSEGTDEPRATRYGRVRRAAPGGRPQAVGWRGTDLRFYASTLLRSPERRVTRPERRNRGGKNLGAGGKAGVYSWGADAYNAGFEPVESRQRGIKGTRYE